MTAKSPARKFRVSPIEVMVFAGIGMFFLNSVYDLFRQKEKIQSAAVIPFSQPGDAGQNRGLASVSGARSLQVIPLECKSGQTVTVTASKIGFSGAFCPPANDTRAGGEYNALIRNEATGASWSVFADPSTGSFTTDYVALKPGENRITIQFIPQLPDRSDRRPGESLMTTYDVTVTRE